MSAVGTASAIATAVILLGRPAYWGGYRIRQDERDTATAATRRGTTP